MKITVGSKNQTKIRSVKDAIDAYLHLFPGAEVVGVDVQVELFGHPKNIQETVNGAISRAKEAFIDCEYSFGLEGGLIEVPESKSGYMETSACAIYDGKNIYLGLSPAFEYPKEVLAYILDGKGDASKAFKDLGLTHHEKLGAEAGGITGFLSNGKMPREDFSRYGIIMALIQLEKPELY